jgi:hypothetical protein
LLDEDVLDAFLGGSWGQYSPACLTSIILQKEVSEDDHPENDEEDDDKAEAQLALVIVDSLHPASQQQANTLIKKKGKFSSYVRKFREERLQGHIWGRAS